MPLDLAKFNSAFGDARHRVRRERGDVVHEQARLRALVPDDAEGEDRAWAIRMIESLAKPAPPPQQWSELYHEAGRVAGAAYVDGGTVEEQIAALVEACRKIREIADRAPWDERARIRAMTRSLEHLEDELRDPTWPS